MPAVDVNKHLMRSEDKTRMVRLKDGKVELDAELPHGRGWQHGNGVIDWINMGWIPYDQYMREKHTEEVAARREEELREEIRKEEQAKLKVEAEQAPRSAKEKK
jgi:hypothetical protein